VLPLAWGYQVWQLLTEHCLITLDFAASIGTADASNLCSEFGYDRAWLAFLAQLRHFDPRTQRALSSRFYIEDQRRGQFYFTGYMSMRARPLSAHEFRITLRAADNLCGAKNSHRFALPLLSKIVLVIALVSVLSFALLCWRWNTRRVATNLVLKLENDAMIYLIWTGSIPTTHLTVARGLAIAPVSRTTNLGASDEFARFGDARSPMCSDMWCIHGQPGGFS
jgi:hypothetical protein